ncbi:hypothetical protein Tco_0064151 [Tanacetum coccineum]
MHVAKKTTVSNKGLTLKDKMAEENIPAPTRSDDQLVPVKARLPYGKSNLLLDLQKLQKNPIFHISVDILQNTNFFRAFTASTNWFPLNAGLLHEALEITPVDPAHPFVSTYAGEQVMDFCNEFGNPEVIHFVSKMHVNNLYQPWRAMLTLINQCLTGKTSGSDKPRHPVLQMLWNIVTRSNVDYAELLWKEFVQGIQTFFSHRASLSIPSKKSTPHVIPNCRFTKLIIYYLGSRHNIYRRPESPVYVTGDDFPLGNLKFVPKGEKDEVFGKPIPNELITEAIQQSPYYQQYLEMAARKRTAKDSVKKKTVSPADKSKKPAPAKQTKPVKEKSPKPTPLKKADKAPEPQIEDDEYNLQRGIQMSLESFQAPVGGVAFREPTLGVTQSLPVVEGKGKAIATDEHRRTPVTEEASTRPSSEPQDDTFVNVVHDTASPADAKTGADTDKTNSEGDIEILNVDEDRGENVSNTVALEERTVELDEDQAGSDPGNTLESRPPQDEDQAESNPG